MSPGNRTPALIVKAGARLCALPLVHVVEIMRPLPVEPLAGTPAFVLGAAVIRGAPVPVVDLDAFVGAPPRAPLRFVAVRLGERTAALAVDGVVGVREIDADLLSAAPPLLAQSLGGALDAMGTLDASLLLVLDAGRLVPDEVWALAGAPEAGEG